MADRPVVSILGCGWLGLPLAKHLASRDYSVKGSTTQTKKFSMIEEIGAKPFLVNLGPPLEAPDWNEFGDCDVMIVNFPPQLRSGGGVEKFTSQMAELISALKASVPKKQLIYVSSTSVYGIEQGEVDEGSEPKPTNVAGQAILAAEGALRQEFAERLTIVRPGGLVGPGRYPGRFLAGEVNVRDGDAPVNLVHLDDCVGVLSTLIEKEVVNKIVNLVAPETKTRREFYPEMAKKLGVEEPLFLKSGMENKKKYKRVMSKVLGPELEYEFVHPRIWEVEPQLS